MFELVYLNLAASFPVLTALFWICLIVGGGLLLAIAMLYRAIR